MSLIGRSELARICEINPETLRYYERQKLMASPLRTANNYRRYTPDDVERLQFIKEAKALGFSLKEIRGLLSFMDNKNSTSLGMCQRVNEKIAEIDMKIAQLRDMRQSLGALVDGCPKVGSINECNVVKGLRHKQSARAICQSN
jgi:MerR family transcriptional regulator, copper efflux regulator